MLTIISRTFLSAALIAVSASVSHAVAQDLTVADRLQANVIALCRAVEEQYVYFDARRRHWPDACARAEREAAAATNVADVLAVMERLIDDLYDPHVALNTNNNASPRLIPSGSDLWVREHPEGFEVEAVRPRSGAAEAGMKVGDVITALNETPLRQAALTRIHSGRDQLAPNRLRWAVNAALAGRRDTERRLTVLRDGVLQSATLGPPEPTSPPVDVLSRGLLANGIAWIRPSNSLGNDSLVPAFDEALALMRNTDGLILDLRDTPGGGNTGVAEPMIGRLIDAPGVYQVTAPPGVDPISRQVQPTGPWTYDKPVVVLVGRWTGSMGEGVAIGLDGLGRATVMGSKMAGLAGGTERVDLPYFNLAVWLPTYNLRHVDGTPRHEWSPDREHLHTADNGNDDLLLDIAVTWLQRRP